eukprot:15479027-Alexandrium_andersonii.AAC.1
MSIDVYKCFDQISRELVVCVMEAMGAPVCVLRGWRNIRSSMRAHNCLTGRLEPHTGDQWA